MKALSKVVVTGEIQDLNGNKITNYNGVVNPTVYDKVMLYYTIGNDAADPSNPSSSQPFNLQKNVIYSGRASVVNGDFSFSFIVPKDISYRFGSGKISYYAHNATSDASGYDTSITVGGVNTNSVADIDGPSTFVYE
ncbi:MAG: hypothetical protein IPP51_06215 [Bacteroidetes bacterium]|nr:hypothetical protein [Bacteroidota bacterium]